MLDAQIKADKKSKEGFERYLKQLTDRRNEVVARMEKNGEFAAQFDNSSAQAAYRQMTQDIGAIYEKAVAGHSKGKFKIIFCWPFLFHSYSTRKFLF